MKKTDKEYFEAKEAFKIASMNENIAKNEMRLARNRFMLARQEMHADDVELLNNWSPLE
jgi:hypothetical protein